MPCVRPIQIKHGWWREPPPVSSLPRSSRHHSRSRGCTQITLLRVYPLIIILVQMLTGHQAHPISLGLGLMGILHFLSKRCIDPSSHLGPTKPPPTRGHNRNLPHPSLSRTWSLHLTESRTEYPNSIMGATGSGKTSVWMAIDWHVHVSHLTCDLVGKYG